MKETAVIILAAGQGTRMKSDRAKVLHEVCGVPMIEHVVKTALAVAEHVVVVIGYQATAVREALSCYRSVEFAVQAEQLGTGHAVLCAMPALPVSVRDVVVLCGDTPLIRPETVTRLRTRHRAGHSVVSLVTARVQNPFGYGRIVLDEEGVPMRIVEEADASEDEKSIDLVNTGAYCVNTAFLKGALKGLSNQNAQGEFYLTDVVAEAYRQGKPAVVFEAPEAIEVMGVNTPEELEKARLFMRKCKAPKG